MPPLDDYLALVTSLHRDKPRYIATLTAVLSPLVDAQGAAEGLPAAFDIDTAVGAQLDVVGAWVGRTRQVATPLAGVYFTFDDADLGFDQAVWLGPFAPLAGLVNLDDESYRTLLRAKIAANNWDGTTATAAAALGGLLTAPAARLLVQDNQDMTMDVAVSGARPDAVTRALLSGGYVPLKPHGVAVGYMVTSLDGSACFGFDVDNDYIAGFDSGAWAEAL